MRYPGFDWQMEGLRSDYLADLLEAARCVEEALELIDRALPKTERRRDAEQMVNLARTLAQKGHSAAREIVVKAFHLSRLDDDFFASDVLVEVDGMAGLLYVIDHLGPRLTKANARELDLLRYRAEEIEGKETVAAMLDALASTRTDVRTFLSFLPKPRKYRRRRKWPPMTFTEFRHKLEKTRSGRLRARSRDWALTASPAALKEAARAFEAEPDLTWIKILVGVFDNRPYPLPIDRLAARIKSASADETHFLVQAFDATKRESARRLGLDLLQDEERWSYGFDLLENNFRPGDREMLLDVAQRWAPSSNPWHMHGAVTVMRSLATKHPRLNWLPHLLWLYESSPCAFCREFVMRELVGRAEARVELLEECLWDSQRATRELARETLYPVPA